MRLLILTIILTVIGTCIGQGMTSFDFEGEFEGLPYFWENHGDKDITQWSTDHSVSGKYSVALLDNSEDSFGQWKSGNLYINEEERLAGKLPLSWHETFNIKTGEMRLTVLFFDQKHNIADREHFIFSGKSEGWDSGHFTKRSELVSIPQNAVEFNVSIVSGGPTETVGKYYFDDLSIDFKTDTDDNTKQVARATDLIASWDMEKQHALHKDKPEGWEYLGNFPYLASWSDEYATSGTKCLKIADDDKRSHGMWVSKRTALPEGCENVSLKFKIKTKNLKGQWRVSLCCYDVPVIHNYSQVKDRIDGIFEIQDDEVVFSWSNFNNDGKRPIEQHKYKGKNGFITIEQKINIPAKTRGFRIVVMSGWNAKNTGTIWVDDIIITN